jgi:hypothetical protein
VNRKIDIARQERPLNFLRENAACADLLDRPFTVYVSASRDFYELDRITESLQTLRNPVGLPAGKLTAPRAKS